MHKSERPGSLLDLYKFSLGALIYCTNHMRPPLEELGDSRALELADTAREKLDRARRLQYDWEKQKRTDPLRREGARSLDDRIDRTLSQIANAAERFAQMEADGEVHDRAEELTDDLFPEGVYHITSKTFDDQHVAVNELLDRLEGPYAEHVDALNLNAIVERLGELNDTFGKKLVPETDQIDYDEVETATMEAEDAFHLLVAHVIAEYGDEMETFNRIIEPIHEQTERARRHFNHRGTIPEVDPETGEPIDSPDEIDDDPQNDGGSPDDDGETDTDVDEPDESDGQN